MRALTPLAPFPRQFIANRPASSGNLGTGHYGAGMQDEAEITISGVKLTHDESMTVRVAIDTLANVLAEGLEEGETRALTDRYLSSLSRIQTLLESRETRKQ
jgi:hypothetical protein